MSSLQYKKIKHASSSKNKSNIIKNLTGMNDPAFKSNNTLKKYINQKLNSFIGPKLNIIPKAKSLTKFNDKSKLNINLNNKKISCDLSFPESSNNIKHKNIISSDPKIKYSLNEKININCKNGKNVINKKSKSNSFIILKYNHKNKSLNRVNKKRNENSIFLNKNESPNITESNTNNSNTPINVRQKRNKTTPVNELNKKRCIYNEKILSLNEIGGINPRMNNNNTYKRKDNYGIFNQKINNTKNYRNPVNKNSGNQIKLTKNEINNYTSAKVLNSNNIPLNKSYFREESKISSNNNTRIINRKNNYSIHNKMGKKDDKDTKNRVALLKDKINNLLKNEESFNENQCPVPMPYVKRYSENTIKDTGNENINIENIILNKDLKEPKVEKKIPSPISQIINPNLYCSMKNINKNKKKNFYSNYNKKIVNNRKSK